MSFWTVNRRVESEEVDYGSMNLNSSPAVYYMSIPTRCSAQSLVISWLERNYELNYVSSGDYDRQVENIRRSIHFGIDSGISCTDNIISSLNQLINRGWLNKRWKLINVDCDHFASQAWERRFACSYRNVQCILSALYRLSEFRKRLFGTMSTMPSLWKLQALLESAWSLGFDPVGASELSASVHASNTMGPNALHTSSRIDSFFGSDIAENRNLVGLVDSTVWLGATDLTALFGSIGVRTSIMECHTPTDPSGTHLSLLSHVDSYITSGPVNSGTFDQSCSLPMLLQHEGHSRIVIGLELDANDCPTALIVLDPDTPVEAMRQLTKAAEYSNSNPSLDLLRLTCDNYHWMDVLNSMRLDASQLTQPQYQLLQINGLIENELDLQDAMVPENLVTSIS